MPSVRRSHLEEFRKVLAGYGDEARLVRTLQGNPDPPNWRMQAGTAWHACIEGHKDLFFQGERSCFKTGWSFSLEETLAARRYLGPGLFEVPGSRIFDLGARQLEVTGTCDWIRGLVLQDNKTCFDAPDPKDYEAALQWRFYLLIHECQVFRYNLWHMHNPEPDGYCRLKDVTSIRFWRYPGLEEECREWCRLFLDWCEGHNLLSCLENPA